MRKLTDDLGNVTRHRYDLLGRQRSLVDPDLGRWTWTWDNAGNARTRTDARGTKLTYTSDALNRRTTKTYPNGAIARWNYDETDHGASIGQLTSISDPTGVGCEGDRSRSMSYDERGLVVSSTYCVDADSETMRFEYDRLGRPKAVIYPGNKRIDYTYDPAGRLRDVSGLVGEYKYDPDGHLIRAELGDSTITTWGWDPDRHWLNSIAIGSPVTGPLLRLNSAYAPDGLVATSTAAPGGPNLAYGYDGLHRLTDVTGGLSQHLSWNTVGNLKTDSVTGSYSYPAPGPASCTGSGASGCL